jgi:predicted PurR-regulated permease PerM
MMKKTVIVVAIVLIASSLVFAGARVGRGGKSLTDNTNYIYNVMRDIRDLKQSVGELRQEVDGLRVIAAKKDAQSDLARIETRLGAIERNIVSLWSWIYILLIAVIVIVVFIIGWVYYSGRRTRGEG